MPLPAVVESIDAFANVGRARLNKGAPFDYSEGLFV